MDKPQCVKPEVYALVANPERNGYLLPDEYTKGKHGFIEFGFLYSHEAYPETFLAMCGDEEIEFKVEWDKGALFVSHPDHGEIIFLYEMDFVPDSGNHPVSYTGNHPLLIHKSLILLIPDNTALRDLREKSGVYFVGQKRPSVAMKSHSPKL